MDVSPPRHFPFCIVWTSIPVITWIFPFVGHLGVCKADGTILDFFGPFNVQAGNFGFGNPTRFLQLHPQQRASTFESARGNSFEQWWDEELGYSADFFRTRLYNFCGTNCHSFVAFFLNQIGYKGYTRWNTVLLACLVFFRANYVSTTALLKTWIPFAIIVSVSFYFWRIMFVYSYLALMGIAILYFLLYEYGLGAQSRLAILSMRAPDE